MSLWQKIKRLVSGNAHDALDSMEDVGTASRQIAREMDEKLQAAVRQKKNWFFDNKKAIKLGIIEKEV
ncbi:hypothetical protein [uncultured Flavobacterium sp.]|uniref:PspA/IM30 family protein n=1 Tax=uncultured Flavobacterium sp. TaxID=165435 RepID=UPI002598DECC|nr:hypothetical protein [uncultured Flavobacterium sp.]